MLWICAKKSWWWKLTIRLLHNVLRLKTSEFSEAFLFKERNKRLYNGFNSLYSLLLNLWHVLGLISCHPFFSFWIFQFRSSNNINYLRSISFHTLKFWIPLYDFIYTHERLDFPSCAAICCLLPGLCKHLPNRLRSLFFILSCFQGIIHTPHWQLITWANGISMSVKRSFLDSLRKCAVHTLQK